MEERQILIVDDSPAARDAVARYARATGWVAADSDGTFVPSLREDLPTLVLLDYLLGPFRQERYWLKEFRERYPLLPCAVYLLTGRGEEEWAEDQQQLVMEGRLAGILKKPLDVTRLEELLTQGLADRDEQPGESPSPGELLLEVMASRTEGVRVLRATDLEEVYRNPVAALHPFDADARRWLQHLTRRLDEGGNGASESLEWDQEHAAWLRRRIFRAGRWFWLIEKRSSVDPWGDPDASHLLAGGSWEERLAELARLLQNQWGITRVRLYQMVPLADTGARRRYRVQPLWQRGDGFPTGEAEADWLAHEFLADEHPDLLGSDQAGHLVHPVSDEGPGAERIAWGNAPNVMRIPVNGFGDTPLGLISLDRRSDHLKVPVPWVEDSPWDRRLTRNDYNHMAGLLDAVRQELRRIIQKRQHQRREVWHRTLTELIVRHAHHATALGALTSVLKEFQVQWTTPGIHPRDIYLLRHHPGDHLLQPWAGVGPLWEARQAMPSPPVPPFREALKGAKVIHDLPRWIAGQPERRQAWIREMAAGHPGAVEGLASWVGLPVHADREVIALLVVTFPSRDFVTEPRLEGLRQFAERLAPMVRWGEEEMRRDWLRRALAHEYREPATRLLALVEKLPPETQPEMRALVEYQWALVHNLHLLGSDDRSLPSPSSPAPAKPLAELLEPIVATLTAIYPGQRLVPPAEGLRQCLVPIPHAALHQLLFNLLENACKYGAPGEPIIVTGEPRTGTLRLSIGNRVDRPIPRAEAKRIFQPYVRGSNAVVAKGAGIGLAVARRLSDHYGLELELADRGTPPERRVRFSLRLPCAGQPPKE